MGMIGKRIKLRKETKMMKQPETTKSVCGCELIKLAPDGTRMIDDNGREQPAAFKYSFIVPKEVLKPDIFQGVTVEVVTTMDIYQKLMYDPNIRTLAYVTVWDSEEYSDVKELRINIRSFKECCGFNARRRIYGALRPFLKENVRLPKANLCIEEGQSLPRVTVTPSSGLSAVTAARLELEQDLKIYNDLNKEFNNAHNMVIRHRQEMISKYGAEKWNQMELIGKPIEKDKSELNDDENCVLYFHYYREHWNAWTKFNGFDSRLVSKYGFEKWTDIYSAWEAKYVKSDS